MGVLPGRLADGAESGRAETRLKLNGGTPNATAVRRDARWQSRFESHDGAALVARTLR